MRARSPSLAFLSSFPVLVPLREPSSSFQRYPHGRFLATLDELSRFVHERLCQHDPHDPQQSPLSRSVLTRASRACGLYFVVLGPRRVATYAVWAGEEDRILFYDSQGQRFAQARLGDAPDPRQAEALAAASLGRVVRPPEGAEQEGYINVLAVRLGRGTRLSDPVPGRHVDHAGGRSRGREFRGG